MDHTETHWRINSSFSPPPPGSWDCRFVPDGLTHATDGAPIYGSSASSQRRESRSRIGSEQYHHYSVSDGLLSYHGSPSDNHQAPQWMPHVRRYDLGEFSTPAGGARPEASVFSQSNEQEFTGRVPSMSSSLGLPSPHSVFSCRASSSKPIFFPPRNFSGRHSFMSKPVYPLIYRNPVSDAEMYGSDLKFHKALTQFHNTSSLKMEGFRWSDTSSNESGLDGDTIDICLETQKSPYKNSSAGHQRCALCERPLWQKSPLSAHRIVRSSDMPVAGVLPCCHVFHAECLEETTPKSQVHEPPCPLCQQTSISDVSVSFSEPLQPALRSARRSQRSNLVDDGVAGSSSSSSSGGYMRRSQSLLMPRRGGSLLKSHLKNPFSFKAKMGKDLFGAKMSGRSAVPSASLFHQDDNHQSRCGRLRSQQHSK